MFTVFTRDTGKQRQQHTFTTPLILWRNCVLFPIFENYRIVLFTLPFQTWKNMKACVHPNNQSWSLARRRKIDLLCLEEAVWFPPFFCPKVERNACFVSPVFLPQRDIDPWQVQSASLTFTSRGAIDHSNTGISNAPWDLKSLSKDISWFLKGPFFVGLQA